MRIAFELKFEVKALMNLHQTFGSCISGSFMLSSSSNAVS